MANVTFLPTQVLLHRKPLRAASVARVDAVSVVAVVTASAVVAVTVTEESVANISMSKKWRG